MSATDHIARARAALAQVTEDPTGEAFLPCDPLETVHAHTQLAIAEALVELGSILREIANPDAAARIS